MKITGKDRFYQHNSWLLVLNLLTVNFDRHLLDFAAGRGCACKTLVSTEVLVLGKQKKRNLKLHLSPNLKQKQFHQYSVTDI